MYSSLIFQELSQQRLSETYCDVTLRLGSSSSFTPLKAHACVLGAASQFFQDHFKESKERDINLLDTNLASICEPETLLKTLPDIINAIYTGQAPTLETSDQIALFNALKLKHFSSPTNISMSFKADHKDKFGAQMEVSFCHKCHLLFTSKEEFVRHQSQSCLRKFTCRTCGEMFPKVQILLNHLLEIKHGELICSICNFISESQKDLESHIQVHAMVADKPYFCLQCESRFPSRKTLIHHLPKHSLETPHVCHVCTKGFKWKQSLTLHMTSHSLTKKFECKNCEFSTLHSSTFKSHLRLHTGDTLACSVEGCTFQTVRKHNLFQHSQTHTKDKPFQCELCGKSFSLVKNMRRHKASQHDSGAPKYNCNLCSYRTHRSDKYSEHLKKNHPYEKDRLLAENKKAKESKDFVSEISSFNHIFEPINLAQKAVNDSDLFVESAEVVSSLTNDIDNVLLTTNL